MAINGSDCAVEPFYEITQAINKPLPAGRCEAFLMGFQRQIAEAYVNDSKKKTTILNQIPFATIITEDNKGAKTFVSLYPLGNTDAYGNVRSGTVERYYAAVKKGELEDFMIVQHLNYKRILWGYESFFAN